MAFRPVFTNRLERILYTIPQFKTIIHDHVTRPRTFVNCAPDRVRVGEHREALEIGIVGIDR